MLGEAVESGEGMGDYYGNHACTFDIHVHVYMHIYCIVNC